MFQTINPERSRHRHTTKMILRDSIFIRWKTVFSAILFILFFICIQQAWTAVPTEEKSALVKLYINTDGENSWSTNTGWVDHLTTDPCDDSWYGITCNAVNDSVTSLILESNNLSGSLPPELGNLSQLSILHLSFNNISGSIPAELGGLNELTEIHLRVNNLSGSIPPQLGNLPNLRQLSLHGNILSGNIPEQLGNLSTLTSLRLHQNILSGTIPVVLGDLTQLLKLHLSDNNLFGSIPPELGKLSKLTQLLLSGNSLSGGIPVELGNLGELLRLSIERNALTGPIPNYLGKLGKLQYLTLNDNLLIGSIPAELGSLSELTRLFLHNNHLTGSIPKQLGSLGQLTSLRLQNNSLYDAIPAELGNLSELQQLDLHINELCGALPSTLSNLNNLTDGTGLNLNFNFLATTVDPLLDDFIFLKSGSSDWKLTQGVGGCETYTISSGNDANGRISPSGDIIVNEGDNQKYTITPDNGYHIDDVLVDDISIGFATSYTFYNIRANHSITASFGIGSYYSLSVAIAGRGAGSVVSNSGSISCPGICDIQVEYGTSVTLEAVPENGSTFIRWSGGCTGDKTTCTLTADKNINVTAEFYSFPWSIFIPSIISGASP